MLAAVVRHTENWAARDDRGSFRVWLFRIAFNLGVKFATRPKHQRRLTELSGDVEHWSVQREMPRPVAGGMGIVLKGFDSMMPGVPPRPNEPTPESTAQDAERKPDKHDFTNLQRLAAVLENFDYPENAPTTITVWCQGGGKGTSVQVKDASLDIAAACHLIVDGHDSQDGLDLENVAVQSADRKTIRFVNIKEKCFAGEPGWRRRVLTIRSKCGTRIRRCTGEAKSSRWNTRWHSACRSARTESGWPRRARIAPSECGN